MKRRIMFVFAVISGFLAQQAWAVPIDSEILNQSEMEKAALCETRKQVTRDLYFDDPNAPPILNMIDFRAEEGGTLLISQGDYAYTVNPDLSGYSIHVSSACINFVQKMAERVCAIERKPFPPMNQDVTSKPKSAQVTARIFSLRSANSDTLVGQRLFEEALPAPQMFSVLNYQVSCDGNGSMTNIVVDKMP